MFQPREGGPAIEEADGHDDEAQPVAVEEGLKDEKSSGDFPEEEVKPPGLEEDAKSARSQIISMKKNPYDFVTNILCTRQCCLCPFLPSAKRRSLSSVQIFMLNSSK